MTQLVWEADNGRTIIFNGDGSFFYSRVTDALSADEHVIKAPGQDGATTMALTLSRPTIHITGSITAQRTADSDLDMDNAVDELNRAFLPNVFGQLTEYRAGIARMIRCRPAARPTLGVIIQRSRTVDIDFIADMPRWVEADETVLELGREQGLLRFPLRLPTKMGLYVKDAVIDNRTGDLIYPVIEIFSTSELVRLTNETSGLKIEINRAITDGQKMVIDNANTAAWLWERSAGVWVRVENVSDWLTHDSEYWAIENGLNYITLRNERVDVPLIALVRYNRPI